MSDKRTQNRLTLLGYSLVCDLERGGQTNSTLLFTLESKIIQRHSAGWLNAFNMVNSTVVKNASQARLRNSEPGILKQPTETTTPSPENNRATC